MLCISNLFNQIYYRSLEKAIYAPQLGLAGTPYAYIFIHVRGNCKIQKTKDY
jgi:hypothetical protein